MSEPAEDQDGILQRRKKFYEYFRTAFPRLAVAKFGRQVEGTDLITGLADEWRPSREQLEAAREGLRDRREKTRWSLTEGTPVQVRFSRLLETYRDSLSGLQEVAKDLKQIVGTEVLDPPEAEHAAPLKALAEPRKCFRRELLFAPETHLLSCVPAVDEDLELRFLVELRDDGESTNPIHLPGASPPIHTWNKRRGGVGEGTQSNDQETETPAVIDFGTPGVAEDYLRFFCHHVSGSEGFFLIVEGDDEILGTDEAPEPCEDRSEEPLLRLLLHNPEDADKFRKELRKRLFPITRLSGPEEAPPRLAATVFYHDHLFHAGFHVLPDGMVEMKLDTPVELDEYPAGALPLEPLRVPGAWKRLSEVAQPAGAASSEENGV